jgi:ABC-type spermidine/putrescine transport system permease subunit II
MAGEANDIVDPRGKLVRGALTGWAVLVYFFLFAPIVLLILFSFNANQYGTLPMTGWTTHWYQDAFNDYQIQDAVKTTLSIALEVTIITTVAGTAAAFPLVRSNLPFRSGIRAALTLPIMLPGLLIGVSLLTFFTSTLHLQLSNQTAVIGQAVYTTPFVITLFLIGAGNTLPIYIYTQVKFGITPEVNAVATMLIAASLTISAVAFALPSAVRAARRRRRQTVPAIEASTP